ncbi:MAG: hypothetical protein U0929_05670 [Planctomycetaceae bacterium]
MLSSRLRIVAVLAGLLLAAPSFSQAQGPGGGGGRRGGPQGRNISAAGLLRIEEVQKELGVTDEQKAEFTKAMESMQGPGAFNREEFRKLSQEERDKKLAEFRKEGEERSKKADEAVKALLKPEQWTRLSELRLQREGVRALSREDVQTQLGLTDEQKAKIKTLAETPIQGFANFEEMSEEERAKLREEMTARREAFNKGMAEVLTPEQKETWTKLQGAKFEFPQRGFGGGQGGGRRRRPE